MFNVYFLPIIIFVALGLLSGVLLTIAAKVFAVKTDERLGELVDALPGINCGACGFSGCAEYAKAVLGGSPANSCLVGGAEVAGKLSGVMGVSAEEVAVAVAFVHCSGNCENTERKFSFEGTHSCLAANRFYSGSESCTHACLGFGDCAAVCPNGAITVVDTLARVNKTLCVGCGLCARACPNKLISVKKIDSFVDVACSSTDNGKLTKSLCKKGCIGCKICEKKCPSNAIHVENDLARIDYDKCTICGECVKACPTGAIQSCNLL